MELRGVKKLQKEKEDARELAIQLIGKTKRAQYDRWIAEDIVEECEHVIREITYCGRTDYSTADEVVSEYLGLDSNYTWIFLPD